MPLTSSVVQQVMLHDVVKKSRFSLKRCSAFRTVAKIYLSEKTISGLGAI